MSKTIEQLEKENEKMRTALQKIMFEADYEDEADEDGCKCSLYFIKEMAEMAMHSEK